ncbi:MAG: metal-dependent transcriptional regulator [Ruminococcaceae bacterium]|nr:metal-dependent transcriptional regulator [Oscillospiraceae bacterium]
MHLQESGEMYLESILVLSKNSSSVRAIDICEYLGYSKPSVSRALGLLREGGYVVADKHGFLTLTDEGRAVAEKIYDRHTEISAFLVNLGVSADVAAEDACKIEHVISDESLEAIKNYMKGKN